jgi:hypothetical protein
MSKLGHYVVLVASTLVVIWGADSIGPDFRDVAPRAGLTFANTYGEINSSDYILESTGNGALIFDFDRDGLNDILITNGTRLGRETQTRSTFLYRNLGSLQFEEIGRQSGLSRIGWSQGACAGDFDNDGDDDVFITFWGQNALYENLGKRFEEISSRARLRQNGQPWNSGCTFLDYDNDGYLDLFVANYVRFDLNTVRPKGPASGCNWKGLFYFCGPTGLPQSTNFLYRNNRDGTFSDASLSAGLHKVGGRFGFQPVAADFDNDGRIDIYLACDLGPSLLFWNRGNGTFEEGGEAAGVAYGASGNTQAGMGATSGDYNGDGLLDIAKTNFSGDLPSLYLNKGGRHFEDMAEAAHLGVNRLLGWGIQFLDFDEDGHPDLFLSNGHVYPELRQSRGTESYLQKTLVYRNRGDASFEDLTTAAGPAFSVSRPARGLASGDLDGDGLPEIVIVNLNQPPSLLKAQVSGHHAILLRLMGRRSNRSGIGARVSLVADGHRQTQTVLGGASFYSQSDLTLHFGLGTAPFIEKLEVTWPSGLIQTFEQLAGDQLIVISEGTPQLLQSPLRDRYAHQMRPRKGSQ